MDFKKLSIELDDIFEKLGKKKKEYDPRLWENLWTGSPARWVLKFLAQAMAASVDSTCLNRHTGACLVDIKIQPNGEFAPFAISSCFNGAPTGAISCLDNKECYYKELARKVFCKKYKLDGEMSSNERRREFNEFKKRFFQFCLACHAEANAIYFSSQPAFGKILFSTTDPCPECAKMIVQNGIGAIIYAVPYKKDEKGPCLAEQSRRLFEEANIPCVNINIPEKYFSWLADNVKNAGQAIFDAKYDLW